MKWKKIIILSFVLILFLVTLQKVLINIYYIGNKQTEIGYINKVHSYTDTDGYSTMMAFYLENSKGENYRGTYSVKDHFFLIVGDTVSFRKMHNGTNAVRVIKKNGITVQKYYGAWDLISILFLISFVLLYKYMPGIIKKMKKDELDNLFKDF